MYEDYYGFTERPFQLTPDPRFWFESRTHATAMAYLGFGLAQGEGFIVITGEVGAGKTTLVGHLMATLDRARLNAIHLVSTQVEPEDMLRLVAQALGEASDGLAKAQLLDRIERALRAEAAQGRRTLLIVDEVQNLAPASLEELRMLSNFTRDAEPLLQIFLLGQPEFRDRLARSPRLEQLRQRVIATHHLTAMEEGEVGPYLLHRLGRAGWRDRPSFAEDAFEALHRHSGGVPRRLNLLAGRVLLHGAIEGIERVDGETVDFVAADMDAERAVFAGDPVEDVDLSETVRGEMRDGLGGRRLADRLSDPALAERLMRIEERVDAQEDAVRRALELLVAWAEQDDDALLAHAHHG